MDVLTIDIGGTNVKLLASGQTERQKFPSGRDLTPHRMVAHVKELTVGWKYDVISIGYPGRVVADRAVTEPRNLGRGWVGFDFAAAFGYPVKVINDAELQALGSYQGGTMLFLGLGTGLGSALIVRGHIVSMEIRALSYRNTTVEAILGRRGLERLGKKKWRKGVGLVVSRLVSALLLDDVVIGGGNAKKLDSLASLPVHCRLGSNANAFLGGERLWEPPAARRALAQQLHPEEEEESPAIHH